MRFNEWMERDMLSERRFRELLQNAIRRIGSQKAAAAEWQISPAYLSDVLQGKRAPGKAILAALGYRKVVMYADKYEPEPK